MKASQITHYHYDNSRRLLRLSCKDLDQGNSGSMMEMVRAYPLQGGCLPLSESEIRTHSHPGKHCAGCKSWAATPTVRPRKTEREANKALGSIAKVLERRGEEESDASRHSNHVISLSTRDAGASVGLVWPLPLGMGKQLLVIPRGNAVPWMFHLVNRQTRKKKHV